MNIDSVNSVLIDGKWHRIASRSAVGAKHRMMLACGMTVDTTPALVISPVIPSVPEDWNEEESGVYTPAAPLEWRDSNASDCPGCA